MAHLCMMPVAHVRCRCGAAVELGYSGGIPTVLHAIPICRDFAALDTADYVDWLNEQLAIDPARVIPKPAALQ